MDRTTAWSSLILGIFLCSLRPTPPGQDKRELRVEMGRGNRCLSVPEAAETPPRALLLQWRTVRSPRDLLPTLQLTKSLPSGCTLSHPLLPGAAQGSRAVPIPVCLLHSYFPFFLFLLLLLSSPLLALSRTDSCTKLNKPNSLFISSLTVTYCKCAWF